MKIKPRLLPLVMAVITAGLATAPKAANALTKADRSGIITIYNKTSIHLNYQLRFMDLSGKWSKWENYRHKHPRNGWHYYSFPDAERIQIRFDRIGGDNEFTEKIFELKFNTITWRDRECRHKGRPYSFKFDPGGRLLLLLRKGW